MNAATLSGPDASRSMTPAMKASRLIGWVSFAIGAAQLLDALTATRASTRARRLANNGRALLATISMNRPRD